MSPQVEATKLPPGYTLKRRPTCQPLTDDRLVLRDERGNVRAAVEIWVPEMAN